MRSIRIIWLYTVFSWGKAAPHLIISFYLPIRGRRRQWRRVINSVLSTNDVSSFVLFGPFFFCQSLFISRSCSANTYLYKSFKYRARFLFQSRAVFFRSMSTHSHKYIIIIIIIIFYLLNIKIYTHILICNIIFIWSYFVGTRFNCLTRYVFSLPTHIMYLYYVL